MSHKKKRSANGGTPDQHTPGNSAPAPTSEEATPPAATPENVSVSEPRLEPNGTPEQAPTSEPEAAPVNETHPASDDASAAVSTSTIGPEAAPAAAQDAAQAVATVPPAASEPVTAPLSKNAPAKPEGPSPDTLKDSPPGATEDSASSAADKAAHKEAGDHATQSVKTPESAASDKPNPAEAETNNTKPPKKGFDPQRFAENFSPPPKPRNWLRKLLFVCLGLLLLLLAAAAYAAFETDRFLNTPAQNATTTLEVEILRGDTFGKVATRLEKAGIINNALYFRLYAMWEKRTASIQAGVFEFSSNWTPKEVLHHLVFGHPVLYRLTIREGLPWWEVAKLVEENGFATAEDFKEVIHDPEFLSKHNIPFDNAEGFLFPDTYLLRKPKELNKDAALALANRLVGTFENKTKDLFTEMGMDKDADKLKQTIILASMVEKETGIAAERPLVAGVFANRLKLGMLMQCDPTIIYGLGENFNGNIRKRDLEDDKNPYNTYRHAGLPPGPICSPGLSAIAAAVHPAEHDYLYFVATKAGGEHVFNATLSGHNKAVNKYQRSGGN